MRIVVLDGYTMNPGDNPWTDLAALGELEVHDRSTPEEIVPRAQGAEIVVTNKAPLSGQTMAALTDLQFIAVTATGVNVVDLDAAASRTIAVSNVPTYGTESVAQFTVALLLELASGVGEHDRLVHAGGWCEAPDFSFWRTTPRELSGLTIGIVGFGAIGQRVGAIASALGMSVLAAGRPGSEGSAPSYGPFAWREVDALFEEADVVSLHCPLTPATENLVDQRRLGRMKKSAFLLNTARGGLVDEEALARSLRNDEIAGAAVDVVSREPMARDNVLLTAPRCLVTPHMAWATLAARRRLMRETVENVRAFLSGTPTNRVA